MEDAINIEELRAGLFDRIAHISSRDLLLKINDLLLMEEQGKDWWDDLTEKQKMSIDAGLADLQAGRRKSHSEVMKKYGM